MMATFCFTIKVVGSGENQQEAWEDAKQGAEQKLDADQFDEVEEISSDE